MLTSGTEPGPAASKPPWRLWLPRVLLESLFIVFSVLFALAVDQWRAQRARVARASIALQSIHAELEANRASVQRARDNHLAMRDSLRTYISRREPLPARIYLGGIFKPALPHSAAWESAREIGVTADLPYELVLELSKVYDSQERYRALSDALLHDVMGEIQRDGVEPVLRDRAVNVVSLQEDFANREYLLMQRYNSALAALNKR
jgi:type II secretory pathway pseudopilin PulG